MIMKRIFWLIVSLLLCGAKAFGAPDHIPAETTGTLLMSGGRTSKNTPVTSIRVTSSPANILLSGSSVLTTASLTVNTGDPWRYNNTATGLELEGIGGTWTLPASTKLEMQATTATVSDWYVFGQSSLVDFRPVQITAPLDPGSGTSLAQNQRFLWRAFDPVTGRLVVSNNMSGINFGVHDNTYDTQPATPPYAKYSINGAAVFSSATKYAEMNGAYIKVRSDDSGATDYFGTGLGQTGAIIGDAGLFNRDVHAQRNIYAVKSMVVGSRQQLTDNYSLQVHSVPTTASVATGDYDPATSYTVLAIRTSQLGAHYLTKNASGTDYRGYISNSHNFDETILTSGSLETSGTILEGTKRVVTPDKVTAGAGISLSTSDSAGTVQITNSGVVTEADTLQDVVTRGNETNNSDIEMRAGTADSIILGANAYRITVGNDTNPGTYRVYDGGGALQTGQTEDVDVLGSDGGTQWRLHFVGGLYVGRTNITP